MKRNLQLAGLSVLVVATTFTVSLQFRQQAALERLALRLDRIEDQPRLADASDADGSHARFPQARIPSIAMASWTSMDDKGARALSPEAQGRIAKSAQVQLESTFSTEPINPAWAGSTMRAVEAAIVDVVAAGAPTPGSAQVDCRSRSCRIRISLADYDQSGQFAMPLLAEIAAQLPVTQSVELPSADGNGLEMYIYASK